jgi:hypothetical protein
MDDLASSVMSLAEESVALGRAKRSRTESRPMMNDDAATEGSKYFRAWLETNTPDFDEAYDADDLPGVLMAELRDELPEAVLERAGTALETKEETDA